MSEYEWESPRVPSPERPRLLRSGRSRPDSLVAYRTLEYPWESDGWLLHRAARPQDEKPSDHGDPAVAPVKGRKARRRA